MMVTLPWPPKECSPNARCHWSKKAKAAKKYRADCFYLAKAVKLSIDFDGPIHLWITFNPPSRRSYDADNCVAQIKAGIDGLADAMKVNDKRFVLHPFVSDKIGGDVVVRVSVGSNAQAQGAGGGLIAGGSPGATGLTAHVAERG